MTGNYYISKKLGIRIYAYRKTAKGRLWSFLFILFISVFIWFYVDSWISHWLRLYWDGIQNLKINDEFRYLWLGPVVASLEITLILMMILFAFIALSLVFINLIDWIISKIKWIYFKLIKFWSFVILGLLILIFTGCKRYDRMAEEFRTIRAISANKTLDPTFNDTIKAKQICGIIESSKHNYPQRVEYFPWREVYKNMLEKPDSIIFDYDICKECKSSRIQLYYQSPLWTWENLCGEAGHMVICPVCKTQDFHLEIMN